MFSTIIPELMSIAVFVLTILCLQAGHSNDYMSDFAILTMNTTGWKANYTASTSLTLPIRDYYSVYMETSCKGWYGIKNVSLGRQAESNCTKPSSYSEFLPSNMMLQDLQDNNNHQSLASLGFSPDIENAFNERFNLQLHVAYVFYVLALVFVGMVIVWGFLACCVGSLASYATVWVSMASTWLFISSVIVTCVQSQATALINDRAPDGVVGTYNAKFLVLTWVAYGLCSLSTCAWLGAGVISATYRE